MLSSFFYGYIITQLPGGFIATRLSGKHVFGLGVLLTALLTLLTPIAAVTDIRLLIALRVVEGFCEVWLSACVYTHNFGLHVLLHMWFECMFVCVSVTTYPQSMVHSLLYYSCCFCIALSPVPLLL